MCIICITVIFDIIINPPGAFLCKVCLFSPCLFSLIPLSGETLLEEDLVILELYHCQSWRLLSFKRCISVLFFSWMHHLRKWFCFKGQQSHLGPKQSTATYVHLVSLVFWYLVCNCGDFSWKQPKSPDTQEQMPMCFYSSSIICTTTRDSSLDWISIVWELDPSHTPKAFTEPENNSKRKWWRGGEVHEQNPKTQSLVRV